jgi:hypothetical protein
MDPMNANPAEAKPGFTDSLGTRWTPVLTTPALIRACRACNLTIASLTEMNLNLADLIETVWYACEAQAKTLGVSHDQFFERLSPDRLQEAMAALYAAVRVSFPSLSQMIAGSGKQAQTPLGTGPRTTS